MTTTLSAKLLAHIVKRIDAGKYNKEEFEEIYESELHAEALRMWREKDAIATARSFQEEEAIRAANRKAEADADAKSEGFILMAKELFLSGMKSSDVWANIEALGGRYDDVAMGQYHSNPS